MATTPQAKVPELYHWDRYGALECVGCMEIIEIPKMGYLMIDGKIQNVEIRSNPEHLMMFKELHNIDHEKCLSFGDAQKAKDFREHRKLEGRRNHRLQRAERALQQARL